MGQNKKAARTWIRQQGKSAQRQTLPVVSLGIVGTIFAIAQTYAAALLLQAALSHKGSVLWPAIGFAVFALLRAAVSLLSEHAAFSAGATARRRLRGEALANMVAAGPIALRRHHSGEWAATLIDRVEALDGLFSRWLPAARLAVVAPLLVAIGAAIVDPIAGVILIATGLLVPVAMALAGIGAAGASRRQFLALSRLQARFLDRVRGIATIVLAGRAEDEADALAKAADELRHRTMRVLRVAFLSSAALDCAAVVAIVILALRNAAILLHNPAYGISAAIFTLLLVPEFFAPLRAFAAAYQDQFQGAAAAEAFADIPAPSSAPEEPSKIPSPAVRTIEAHGVSIAFENVSYSWDPTRAPALDGVSFRLPAGESLVLVGASGAGKSTAIELLLGTIRPTAGKITLNGIDIVEIVPAALARLTAWIGQQPILFAASVRENILFARPEATTSELEEAIRRARLDQVVASLPRGLDTPLGEGGYGLSGGQAQRVAIARAFLKNAPLLLLDEPTAHLDPVTEAEVLESLKRLAIGRTAIMASHAAQAHIFGGRRLELREGRLVAQATRRGVA